MAAQALINTSEQAKSKVRLTQREHSSAREKRDE